MFAFLIGSFPNTVDAAVTTLLSFYRPKVIIDFLSFTTSQVPLSFFFISSTYINGEFSVRFDLTVPVVTMPLDFNNRKSGTYEDVVHNIMVTGFRY